jgi:hypothetical protein
MLPFLIPIENVCTRASAQRDPPDARCYSPMSLMGNLRSHTPVSPNTSPVLTHTRPLSLKCTSPMMFSISGQSTLHCSHSSSQVHKARVQSGWLWENTPQASMPFRTGFRRLLTTVTLFSVRYTLGATATSKSTHTSPLGKQSQLNPSVSKLKALRFRR